MILILSSYLVVALTTAFWLRHLAPFFQRLNDLNWQALVTLDVIAAFVIFWPLYLVGVLRDRPLPWATISTFCAACALQDRPWALKATAAIDALFFVLTSQREHCLKAYARWSAPLAGA